MQQDLTPGEVVLVGGGPGDPDLLTVAGLRAIQQADVIIHDRLGPVSALGEARPEAELINVGKVPRGDFTPQEEINALLIERARRGLRVVRLKGGDNCVFGRGGEEWQECAAAGIPVRVIPGVTSAVAVPALARIPVTHRSLTQGFTVVSGHVPPGDDRSQLDWRALAQTHTTLVLHRRPLQHAQCLHARRGGHRVAQGHAVVMTRGECRHRRVRAAHRLGQLR